MMAKPTSGIDPVHAIVPLNVLSKSKARLASVLTCSLRAQLTIAMLSDVMSALRGSRQIFSVTIVSADAQVREIAGKLGAQFLWEGERRGLNNAVRLAVRKAEKGGAASVLVIHADLPLVTKHEIGRLVTAARRCGVLLVPSRDGAGTNALFLKPPNVICPRFGKGSFRRHLHSAKAKKVPYKVLRFRGLCFDVDTPTDLHELRVQRTGIETAKFLRTVFG